jgi:hypothetical protein
MNITVNRARGMSVALLLAALLNHGILSNPNFGAGQESRGLLRLARDLTRRTGGLINDEYHANGQMSSMRVTATG